MAIEKIDVIKSIYDNYSKDKSIIHITRHVGNLYQLKFTNFAGTDDYGKINGCLKSTMIDAKLESPRTFKKFFLNFKWIIAFMIHYAHP